MNDFDLDAKLKGIPLPERQEGYWEHFPTQVRRNLLRARPRPASGDLWLPRLAWAGGFVLAVAALLFCMQFRPLKTTTVALQKHGNHWRMQLAQFQTKLRVFMQDEHGMHYLIAEKE